MLLQYNRQRQIGIVRKSMDSFPHSTQVTLLTPTGRGAIAALALAGPHAADLLARWVRFRRSHVTGPTRQILYGEFLLDPHAVEEVVVCHFERHIELHCHGGPAIIRRILEILRSAGAVIVAGTAPSSLEASSPHVAEAQRQLPRALTGKTAGILLDQVQGAWYRSLQRIADLLAAAHIPQATAATQRLYRLQGMGAHLIEPWRVVVAGPPNVGKSSLVNQLLGFSRSLIMDAPGTTRDVLTGVTALSGWPVEISDTAGIHDATDVIETLGMEMGQEVIRSADLILLVTDGSQPWSAAEWPMSLPWEPVIWVHNKVDRLGAIPTDRPDGIWISALTGTGLASLQQELVTHLVPLEPIVGEGVPIHANQRELIRKLMGLLPQDPSEASRHIEQELQSIK